MMACVALVVAVTPHWICRLEISACQKREGHRRVVARLHLQRRPVDRAPIEPGRRPGLEPAEAQVERQEPRRKPIGGRLAMPAGRNPLLAAVDDPAQERPRGQDDGAGANAAAVCRHDAGNLAPIDDQVLDRRLDHLQARHRPDRGLHRGAVQSAVGLGTGPLHGRPARPVEQPELDAGRIRHPAHQPIERIDLAHQMALAEPADGRIAGHLADGGKPVRDERRAPSHARRRCRRLAASMAAADHDDVEKAGAHWSHDRRISRADPNRNAPAT